MKRPLVLSIAALAAVSCAPDRGESEQALREVNARYDRAITSADAATLDEILADDYVYVTAEGEVRDKRRQIANLTTRGLRISSPGSRDVTLRWIGDGAILVGRFPAEARLGNTVERVNERYSSFWTREDGRWRLRHEHASLIPERPRP